MLKQAAGSMLKMTTVSGKMISNPFEMIETIILQIVCKIFYTQTLYEIEINLFSYSTAQENYVEFTKFKKQKF